MSPEEITAEHQGRTVGPRVSCTGCDWTHVVHEGESLFKEHYMHVLGLVLRLGTTEAEDQ